MLPRSLLLLSALALGPLSHAVPNVVTIIMDDVGWGDFSHKTAAALPAIDRLAAEGVTVDRFYVNPICSPTRASLFTGRFAASTGVNNRNGLRLSERTLANDFQDAGYATWMCGKWHLGGDSQNALVGREYHPDRRGFDHFLGLLGGAVDYHTQVNRATGERDWWRNGEEAKEKGYTTDLLVDEAVKLIRTRDAGRPYYLHLAFNAAHGPLQPPSGDKRSGSAHAGVMRAMDAAIGRLMETIRADRDAATTLVVLFGDNGAQEGRGGTNGELRGWKEEPWEGGVRNRALFWWPGVLAGGTRSEQWMWVGDLRPTLLRACGAAPNATEKLAGVSLWSELVAGKSAARPPFLVGHGDSAWIDAPWKLVLADGGQHLFNLATDPLETTDLSSQEPQRLAAMLAAAREVSPMRTGGKGGGKRGGDKADGKRAERKTKDSE